MAFQLVPTRQFKKHFELLALQERKQLRKKVEILAENPFHPSLRCKRIRGTAELFECSVNMDIRIIWCFEGGQIILLLDVGHHDILKQY